MKKCGQSRSKVLVEIENIFLKCFALQRKATS